jgi:hypothetical protein
MARCDRRSGELAETGDPARIGRCAKVPEFLLGIVRVDRNGIGYADLSIGVPRNVVAGARFVPSLPFPTGSE